MYASIFVCWTIVINYTTHLSGNYISKRPKWRRQTNTSKNISSLNSYLKCLEIKRPCQQ